MTKQINKINKEISLFLIRTVTMKVSNILSPLFDILFVLRTALVPTITAILSDPTLLLRWSSLSKIFMATIWVEFGHEVDQKAREAKMRLLCIPGNLPEGVILDVGCGESFA